MTDDAGAPAGGEARAAESATAGSPQGSPSDPGSGKSQHVSRRVRGAASSVQRKGASVGRGVGGWVESRDAASYSGLAVRWYRGYRNLDGGFYSLVLTAFFFVTLLPTALVLNAYARSDPEAAARSVIRRLDLHGATADLVRSVLTSAGGHRLQALLIAVFSVVLFGLGIGRALQLVYARAWGLEPHGHMVWDQARYLGWFFAFLGLIVLLILQLAFLPADWVQWVLAPVWALLIVAFFVWTARFLLHHRVSGREVLPGAILVALGLLVVRLLSSVVLRNWLDWYSTYYGGLGVIMAIFFWILIAASLMVAGATLSPAYAERTRALRARRTSSEASGEGPAGLAEG